MREVTREEFYEFLKDKEYTIKQGAFMHSDSYIDNHTKELIAYLESSSYNSKVFYQIKAIT